MSTSIRSISNTNKEQQCGSYHWHWFYLARLQRLLSDALLMIQQTSVKSLKKTNLNNAWSKLVSLITALVDRGVAVLKVFVSTSKVNARIIAGLALVGIITPVADVFYTFLPQDKVPETEWYYESWYWLFLCLGPYIAILSFSVGSMFILLPKFSDKRSYFFTAPIGFAVAKIWWLSGVTNHDEYLQVPPTVYYVFSFALVALTIYMSNYLAWRKYHRADSFPKRMDGLCQIANMNNPVEAGFVNTWKEMKAKNY